MTKYIVICVSKQCIEKIFESYDDAAQHYDLLGIKDYFIVSEITRGKLEQFKKKAVHDIYIELTNETFVSGTRSKIAGMIIDFCDLPAHLPQRKIVPKVDLDSAPPLDVDKIEDAQIVERVKVEKSYAEVKLAGGTAIINDNDLRETFNRINRRKHKTDRRKNTLYLDATAQNYSYKDGHPSKRYLYHRYISEGLDIDIVLQRISNQIGKKQNIDTYYKYKFELQKILAMENREAK